VGSKGCYHVSGGAGAVQQVDFQAFEAIAALVVVLDVDDRIVHWNHVCSDLTGYSLDEVRGRRPREFLLDPVEVEPIRSALATLPTAERRSRFANDWVTKTGERRWIAWSNKVTKGPDGQPRYVIKTGFDRTESKQAEDTLGRIVGIASNDTHDLREANQHMVSATIRAQELAEEAEAARARLTTSERELREVAEFREMFIGILGHDLRNPLGSIDMTATALLQHGRLDEKAKKQVTRIIGSSKRMTRMISQLLDLTRARLGGGFPLEPKPTDLGEVCRNVVDEFEGPIQLEVEGDVTGTWDPDRLAEALSNIAGNAIEHAAPGTTVAVKAHADGPQVVVEISNRGKPIPDDVLPFIFEPFRRASQHERSATGNLGLGLYIAKQIVHSGCGTLAAYSADGRTTFLMRLPRHAPFSEPPSRQVEGRA
jgi:PAS domain S-box-containing protein